MYMEVGVTLEKSSTFSKEMQKNNNNKLLVNVQQSTVNKTIIPSAHWLLVIIFKSRVVSCPKPLPSPNDDDDADANAGELQAKLSRSYF